METKKKNNKDVTKVICQNCGAEVIIPQHESTVIGTAIGQDSGLGTVVLPTKGGCGCAGAANPMDLLQALSGGNANVLQTIVELIGKIEESGYLDANGIVRRWIPSQCLAMVYNNGGFHENLKARGVDYSWKVLVDDLKKQSKLYMNHDMEGYADRNRWYNSEIAYAMARDYYNTLCRHINTMKHYSHNGRLYIKLKCWMNNGKGVHVDELPMFRAQIEKAITCIKNTKTPKTLLDAVISFDKMIRQRINFSPKEICVEFANAYKAAGAYYTIKDLIMFEGCRLQVDNQGSVDQITFWDERCGRSRKFVETEESLEALERKASAIVQDGVADCGYKMLGLLKDFLEYNKFDFSATQNKWHEQSKLRKALRATNRKNRRSRK